MMAPHPLARAGDGAPLPLAFDEVAERASLAAVYASNAASFAEIGDRRGAAYSLRQAAVALASAADAAHLLAPTVGR